jgi:predicted DNA-binding antitoxin AbrB/MazE fold protein
MARTIKVKYENGVFRPLEPVYLDEGTEREMYLSYEPHLVTPEERERFRQELEETPDDLTDEEWDEIEEAVLGPERMAVIREQEALRRSKERKQ